MCNRSIIGFYINSKINITDQKNLGKVETYVDQNIYVYEKMINEEEYDKDLLEELLAYEDIYKQPARKKCATLAILGIKDLIEK